MPEPTVVQERKPTGTEAHPPFPIFPGHPGLRPWFYLLCLAVLASGIMFFQLGDRMLKGDEGIYANVVDHIIETGDWVYLSNPKGAYFHKPPMYFWLTAATAGLFEDTHFAYRFWSAAFGVASVLLTFVLGWMLFHAEIGLLAALFLVCNKSFLFYHGARCMTMDSSLTFFVLLSFVIYWPMRTGPRWRLTWGLLGLAAGAACLFKPVLGLPFLGILCLHHLLADRQAPLRRRLAALLLGGAVCLLAVLPWHLLQWLQHGERFFDAYFAKGLVQRATTGLDEGHLHGPHFYWVNVSTSSPVFFLFLPSLVLASWAVLRRLHRQPFLLLLAGILGFLGLMTVPKSKLDWYAYPVYPFISVLIAATLTMSLSYSVRMWSDPRVRRIALQASYGLLLVFAAVLWSHTLGDRIPRQSLEAYSPLQFYRSLEPDLGKGNVRLVCFRFARPDLPPDTGRGFWLTDTWYVKRMPAAVWTDEPQQVAAYLADGRPTYVLTGTDQDLLELKTTIDPDGTWQFVRVGTQAGPYPLVRVSRTISRPRCSSHSPKDI